MSVLIACVCVCLCFSGLAALCLCCPLQMMEDFSGLALPPLFGGHILEAELEPGGVELGPGEVMLRPILQICHVCAKDNVTSEQYIVISYSNDTSCKPESTKLHSALSI